jgi:hypothetical protein
MKCTTCFPDERRTNVLRDIASLEGRIAELVHDLETCPDQKVGLRWWLDRLEGAAAARRQVERLEMLLEE